MNLSKAKEIMELNVKVVGKKMPPDTLTALKIGIEALKREQARRNPRGYKIGYLLPGETEE